MGEHIFSFLDHPHDLQHRHYPRYFTRYELVSRDVTYQAFCRQAVVVPVVSCWVRDDLIRQFGLAPAKVAVVPLAPAPALLEPDSPETATVLRAQQKLPERFVFYPAATWPHKNHIMLIRALHLLSTQAGIRVDCVFAGPQTDFYRQLAAEVQRLGLAGQVRFLGPVTSETLAALYKLATAVVIPSRFEAASFPLWEAFLARVPAACSTVTSLPDQAGDAALLFDPDQAADIASAIERLWLDESLRQTLVARGVVNVNRFSWDRTARLFRAHYRRSAGCPLSDEDRDLLAEPAPF